jgi:hypothetical protein
LYLFTVSSPQDITICKPTSSRRQVAKAFSLGAPQGQGLAEVHSLLLAKRAVFLLVVERGQVGLKIQREKRAPAAFLACSRPVFASESSTQ